MVLSQSWQYSRSPFLPRKLTNGVCIGFLLDSRLKTVGVLVFKLFYICRQMQSKAGHFSHKSQCVFLLVWVSVWVFDTLLLSNLTARCPFTGLQRLVKKCLIHTVSLIRLQTEVLTFSCREGRKKRGIRLHTEKKVLKYQPLFLSSQWNTIPQPSHPFQKKNKDQWANEVCN